MSLVEVLIDEAWKLLVDGHNIADVPSELMRQHSVPLIVAVSAAHAALSPPRDVSKLEAYGIDWMEEALGVAQRGMREDEFEVWLIENATEIARNTVAPENTDRLMLMFQRLDVHADTLKELRLAIERWAEEEIEAESMTLEDIYPRRPR